MYNVFYIVDKYTPIQAFAKLVEKHNIEKSAHWLQSLMPSSGTKLLIYIDSSNMFDGFDDYPKTLPDHWHYSQHPDVPIRSLRSLLRPLQSRRRPYETT